MLAQIIISFWFQHIIIIDLYSVTLLPLTKLKRLFAESHSFVTKTPRPLVFTLQSPIQYKEGFFQRFHFHFPWDIVGFFN